MRVLLLNQFYPPDTAATGQLLADVARALAAAGHEVHVVCSRGSYAGGRIPGLTVQVGEDCIRVHRVSAFSWGRRRSLGRMCDWGSYYVLAIGQCLRLGRFDACLALTTPPFIGAIGGLLKQMRGTRLVLWTMDLWPEVAEALGTIRPGSWASRMLRRLAGWVYNQADAVVSLGSEMTQRLCKLGVAREKIVSVHNWVPSEVVSPMPRGRGFLDNRIVNNDQFVVMHSGNMGRSHEFDTILAAAELLKNDGSVIFVFAGDGQCRQTLIQDVERRNLSNVQFIQPVPLEHLAELLAVAHVHLVSLRQGLEGLLVPSKIYGILAAGRPAIMVGSTRNEVAQLLRDSGAGLMVESGRTEELASAIRNLRDRPDWARQMGQAGREFYEQNLGRDRSVAAIVGEITRRREAKGALE